MKTIYFFRHQNHGVLYDMPFTEKPTAAQTDEVRKLMESRYGVECKVNGGELWLRVVSYDALGANESVFAAMKARGEAIAEAAAREAEGASVAVANPKLSGKMNVG